MKRLLLVFLFIFSSLPAFAADAPVDMTAFGRIPVLQDGRIKPLDSLARIMLKRIYGHTAYGNMPASAWLADMFFSPSDAMRARMFYIASPQAAQMLGLTSDPTHLYSFESLAAVLPLRAAYIHTLSQKEKSALKGDEAEVVRIYNAANDFAELIGSFSLVLPLDGVDDGLRAHLGIKAGGPVTVLDLIKNRQMLTQALENIVKSKGTDTQNYTVDERSIERAVSRLSLQEAVDRDNTLVRVIPPTWGGEEWLSPWGVIATSNGSPESAAMLRDWRRLALGYRKHDARTWHELSAKLLSESLDVVGPVASAKLLVEYVYNQLNPLLAAAMIYALGIALIGLTGRFRHAFSLGYIALSLGLALHGVALLMRMFILLRPPVSTLYESLIFVSFIVMACTLWIGRRPSNLAALLAGAFTSFLLMLASWVFAGDGDTLGVLVAVLNTNFWLATHVVCITTGYGCALVTGAIAHIYLFRASIRKMSETALAPLMRLLYIAALLALCFTSIGTILGGIWADQSWGRFWGWDPKENGALLIVLWLLWLLHGRVAKQLSAFSFAALLALINVVVGVAWIGVNLLSVGLHSYGFTDTAANGLLSFTAAEFLYVGVMAFMSARQPNLSI